MLRQSRSLIGFRYLAMSSRKMVTTNGFSTVSDVFSPTDTFLPRHMGSQGKDRKAMLDKLGFSSIDKLVDSTIPPQIRLPKDLSMDAPLTETEALDKLKSIMSKNIVLKSFIGVGYYETHTPGVILRNVLENPGWYTFICSIYVYRL